MEGGKNERREEWKEGIIKGGKNRMREERKKSRMEGGTEVGSRGKN